VTGGILTLGIPNSRRQLAWLALFAIALTGCGHHAQVSSNSGSSATPPRIAPTPSPRGGVTDADKQYVQDHKPIYTEEGLATWYDAPYPGRKAANGQVFDRNAMTAANRTLPMGSLVVVTNEKTQQSATMRITDRGPFIKGRLLDLSPASAKATGVYRAGLVNVRMDVYKTPKPMDTGGRWCVQFGAYEHKGKAMKLKKQLQHKYPDAQVIDFAGDTGHWVRIRPAGDNREQAEKIARHVKAAEGDAFLTRLD
jgi:rare lipoprotein A